MNSRAPVIHLSVSLEAPEDRVICNYFLFSHNVGGFFSSLSVSATRIINEKKKMVLAKIKTVGHPSVSVSNRDMYHGIGPMDPERLNVFRTVREITGKVTSLCASGSASETAVRREAECLFWEKKQQHRFPWVSHTHEHVCSLTARSRKG